jgi:hypothetical protein
MDDNPELPAGWLGKCNAMERAAQAASGELLLFTDADVVHAPLCFATAVSELERKELDFLSLFPRMECVTLWENIILQALVAGLAELAMPGINDPRSSEALGAGALLLVRSDVFRAAGGFEPIKHAMTDDVALARLIKARGSGRVAFHGAPELLHVRLFKGNAHAFWGMTKNILIGLHGRLWMAPLHIALPAIVNWTPIVCVVSGVVERNALLLVAGMTTYAIQYGLLWASRRLFTFQPAKALLFPLVIVPVACCMTRAFYLHFFRGAVHWRGRTIRIRSSA